MRRVVLTAVAAAGVLLAACTSGSSDAGAPTTGTPSGTTSGSVAPMASASAKASPTLGVAPASFEGRCGQDINLQQPLPVPFTFRAADGVTLLGAEFGTGSKGVVALHQLGRAGLCGWAAYAQYLADKGLHVLVFDHRCVGLSTCPDDATAGDLLADTTAARAELVKRGAATTAARGDVPPPSMALLGASQGGGEAIAAAGSQPGWTRAAVLSGALFDLDFGGGVTSQASLPKVQVPVLFLVAEGDPDSPVAVDQALVATARPGIVSLKVLPQGGHGWSLLQPFPGDAFTAEAATVATFLAS